MQTAIFNYHLFFFNEFLKILTTFKGICYMINIYKNKNKYTHVKLKAMHTLYFLLFIANEEKGGVTYKYKHRVTNNHEIECFNSTFI